MAQVSIPFFSSFFFSSLPCPPSSPRNLLRGDWGRWRNARGCVAARSAYVYGAGVPRFPDVQPDFCRCCGLWATSWCEGCYQGRPLAFVRFRGVDLRLLFGSWHRLACRACRKLLADRPVILLDRLAMLGANMRGCPGDLGYRGTCSWPPHGRASQRAASQRHNRREACIHRQYIYIYIYI